MGHPRELATNLKWDSPFINMETSIHAFNDKALSVHNSFRLSTPALMPVPDVSHPQFPNASHYISRIKRQISSTSFSYIDEC